MRQNPQPGDLVGHLIVYGERGEHWTPVLADETRALLMAAQLHGKLYPLVVGSYVDDVTKETRGPND